MTNQSPLSPAAAAVLDAYDSAPFVDYDIGDRASIAAALRAAADQMSAYHSKRFLYSIADYLKLQSIAAELDGTLPTSESDFDHA